MTQVAITDFEAGVMVALSALKIAALETPGFNVDALEKAATVLMRKMQGVQNRQAFELPISCVTDRHKDVIELIRQSGS